MAEKVSVRLNVKNLGYLPRWIIVSIDMMVLMFCFVATFLIFKGMRMNYIVTHHNIAFICSFFGTNLFFFWLFRTYSGIIRHSSYIDAVKLFFSQASVLIVFVLLNFICLVSLGFKPLLNTALFFNTILSFCGLFFIPRFSKTSF